jgi:uncharacterized protein (DUF433 family)
MASIKVHNQQTEQNNAQTDALVEQDVYEPGRHNARLTESGTHVWAIIAYLQGSDWDIPETARAYRVSEASVRAAIDYYERYRNLIDAELLLQDEVQNAP